MGARRLASASGLAFLAALAGLLGAAAGPAPRALASPPKAPPPPLALEESLEQSLSLRGKGADRSVSFVEERRLRARAEVPLGAVDPASFAADTLLGIRIGSFVLERPLGSDPRWRPGRTKTSFRLPVGTPEDPRTVRVRARWSGGTFRLDLKGRGLAPLAEGLTGSAPGDLAVPLDAAARLGPARWTFGGTAAGTVDRTPVPLPGGDSDIVRISLACEGRVLADTEDAVPPVLALSAPAVGTYPEGTVDVTGTVRDDRTIARVTWAIDGGAETDAAFTPDPASGFLGERTASFSFPIPATAGWVLLAVRAYDAAGNSASESRSYLVAIPRDVVFAAGGSGALAARADGTTAGWGITATLTPQTPVPVPAPATVAGVADARAFAVGSGFALALLADGTVVAWGYNGSGQLGDGTFESRMTPAPVAGLDGVVAVTAGSSYAAALRGDGTVWTWGAGMLGQLGDGHPWSYTDGYTRPTAAPIAGIPAMRQVYAAGDVGYALDEGGRIWEWGGNTAGGYAGIVTFPSGFSTAPRRLEGIPDATRIAAGSSMVVGVAVNGTVFAVGRDWYGYGLLGGATFQNGWTVAGVADAVDVACGYAHVLVLRADGTVLGFGNSFAGQVGDGGTVHAQAPVPVPGLSGVESIAASYATSYAVLGDGSLRAWGWNAVGQIGDGTQDDRHSPVVVAIDP